uniref:Uncharacterized protein n=1 Tax=Panagrolaimus sp. JU765 TaxID=591449 RepID=A0AC34PX03_9BILA
MKPDAVQEERQSYRQTLQNSPPEVPDDLTDESMNDDDESESLSDSSLPSPLCPEQFGLDSHCQYNDILRLLTDSSKAFLAAIKSKQSTYENVKTETIEWGNKICAGLEIEEYDAETLLTQGINDLVVLKSARYLLEVDDDPSVVFDLKFTRQLLGLTNLDEIEFAVIEIAFLLNRDCQDLLNPSVATSVWASVVQFFDIYCAQRFFSTDQRFTKVLTQLLHLKSACSQAIVFKDLKFM